MPYKPIVTLSDLQNDKYTLIQNDRDLAETLDFVGLPLEDRKRITGAVVYACNGDYIAVWLTKASAWYELSAYYHPLPFFKPESWVKRRNLPVYWLESNEEYSL